MYANGFVCVRPLPAELHGEAAARWAPLRRLEGGPLAQKELGEHLARERVKVARFGSSLSAILRCRVRSPVSHPSSIRKPLTFSFLEPPAMHCPASSCSSPMGSP